MLSSAACGWSLFFSCSHLNMASYNRESLIFEEGLKENLLKNIEVSLEFARRQVDPLQVKESGQLQKIWCLTLPSGEHLQVGPGPRPPWHWKDFSLPCTRQQGRQNTAHGFYF